jgi:hypothetical protein
MNVKNRKIVIEGLIYYKFPLDIEFVENLKALCSNITIELHKVVNYFLLFFLDEFSL